MAEIISNLVEAHIFRTNEDRIEFLLLKRAEGEYYPYLWQMVNGKIEAGEKAYQTAIREIKEETGLTAFKLWAVPNINSFYSYKNDQIVMIPVFAAEIKPDSKIIISTEHSEFQWCSPEEAVRLLAWPGQRKSVEIITNYIKNESEFFKLVEIPIE